MDTCTEQMLELEQADDVYSVGRALRGVFKPVTGDADGEGPGALLRRLEAADVDRAQPAAA